MKVKCDEKGWLREVWDIRSGALLKERRKADFKNSFRGA
jgi:hypothetical protein